MHKRYKDLQIIQKRMSEKNNYRWENITYDNENQEYGACDFILNGQRVKFRIAKITPTKPGQFVTLYKRNEQGATCAYDATDNFDRVIIHTESDLHSGQFVFTKEILVQKDIISQNNHGGKRGFRVYPPWSLINNKQAKQTQEW